MLATFSLAFHKMYNWNMALSFSYCTHQIYLLNATQAQNHAAYCL